MRNDPREGLIILLSLSELTPGTKDVETWLFLNPRKSRQCVGGDTRITAETTRKRISQSGMEKNLLNAISWEDNARLKVYDLPFGAKREGAKKGQNFSLL